MNAGKESEIELKRQESGSPCDVFLLLDIMFLFVSFWSMAHSERTADMCGNRWKDQDLVIFLIFTVSYFCVFIVNLARTKRGSCVLSISAAIRCHISTTPSNSGVINGGEKNP